MRGVRHVFFHGWAWLVRHLAVSGLPVLQWPASPRFLVYPLDLTGRKPRHPVVALFIRPFHETVGSGVSDRATVDLAHPDKGFRPGSELHDLAVVRPRVVFLCFQPGHHAPEAARIKLVHPAILEHIFEPALVAQSPLHGRGKSGGSLGSLGPLGG